MGGELFVGSGGSVDLAIISAEHNSQPAPLQSGVRQDIIIVSLLSHIFPGSQVAVCARCAGIIGETLETAWIPVLFFAAQSWGLRNGTRPKLLRGNELLQSD